MERLNLLESLTAIIKPFWGTLRGFLIIVSVIVAAALYYWIATDANYPLEYPGLSTAERTYKFFSGGIGGVYRAIGEVLEDESSSSDLRIENVETAGGSQNAISVLTTPKSFGLVQEETIQQGDFLRNHLKYVTPLYLERMHIIYSVNSLEEHRGKQKRHHSNPRLSAEIDDLTLKFFAKATVSTGPVGSGTRVIANYIINEVNAQVRKKGISSEQTIFDMTMAEGYEALKKEKIDIQFVVGGPPLSDVSQLLSDPDPKKAFGLVAIDPSFVNHLNTTYDLALRNTDFKGTYKDIDHVSTLGSYAFLITQRTTPVRDIRALLRLLDANKLKIRDRMGLTDFPSFQLNEFRFLSYFEVEAKKEDYQYIKAITVAFISIVGMTAALMSFLVWSVSWFKREKYFLKITEITSSYLPKSDEVDSDNGRLYVPKLAPDQENIANKAIDGIVELTKLQTEISDDYSSGGIAASHYTFLSTHVDRIKSKLRRNLGERLNEIVLGPESTITIDRNYLRQLFTGDYLIRGDYLMLEQKIESRTSGQPKA